ncbi:MAG: PEPxxWA-CTERM sorting domain-containing protein [Alphaproteobacteria bacterium]|nr:PEPxxWA-CTERM sorting domain-containing protein [Alphaproteobacteria bacterium]MBU1515767.1 PEPxxWA-CTERM sorting domain-containing protein [Alphaproteobacteria bacterium]MBU2097050.1 PEPxxWA-CTERM sorting domain-containing protein [Alphaproteobacteria bacterium]MBU2149566.1 PEPxxWA-CTERM sorting domain-containing protein [Alphaproteobacteria bacterium]MBU2308952.1 PEPxxWA-CTERM sorting domain-containing protein [Alphaproteobacteria bacterium]
MSQKIHIAAALAAICLLAGTGNAQAQTNVVFEDFEGYGASALNFTGFSDLTVASGSVDYIHEPDWGLATPFGDGFVDLDGSTGAGGFLRTGVFTLGTGDGLVFQFNAAGNMRGGSDVLEYGLYALDPAVTWTFGGGNYVGYNPDGTFNLQGVSIAGNHLWHTVDMASDYPWTEIQLRIGADQPTQFFAYVRTASSDNMGPLIDNFQLDLVPVPEPATWALMILGFGLAGAMLRRRYFAPSM